jgi:hypothetical protein
MIRTKKDTIKILRNICKKEKVKVIFKKFNTDASGICVRPGKIIYINKNLLIQDTACTVFHELGHVYCMRNKIWKQFHLSNDIHPSVIFRIENWIDNWARRKWDEMGMRKYFGQYKFYYAKKDKKTVLGWIKENY